MHINIFDLLNLLNLTNVILYSTKAICYTKAEHKFAKYFEAEKCLKDYNDSLLQGKAVSYVTPDFSECPKLKPYFDKLAEHLTIDELSLVTNNIKNLKFRRGIFSLVAAGSYDVKKNKLVYYFKHAIGHEFLHLASAYYDKEHKIDLCGFHVYIGKKDIGRGLNEGYTELLASRLFNKKGEITAYNNLVSVVEMLEVFFDKPEDMRRMYFNNDLVGFIHVLERYMTKEEAFNLLFEMDKYSVDISKSRALNLKNFIYKRFMERVTDPEKVIRMNKIVNGKKKRECEAIKKKNVVSIVERKTNKDILKAQVRKTGASGAIAVCLFASILARGLTLSNQIHCNERFNETVLTSVVEYGAYRTVNFEEQQANLIINNDIDGQTIYRYLLSQKVNYCKILGEYYTPDGGDITIRECEATKVIGENKDKILVENILIVTLPNGNLFVETNNIDTIKAINVISKETYPSRPFTDILELNLGYELTTYNDLRQQK